MTKGCSGEFFGELKEWSDRKLRLLESYLHGATKILGSIDEVYYVDGFAGAGTYDDGSIGSPLRAAQRARQYQEDARSYSLKCINIEEDEERYANLQDTTAEFGDLVLNLRGSFTDNLNTILHEIGNKPVVCFLDPFGMSGIDFAAVQRLINRGRGPTDLWIRFDYGTVRRLDGSFSSLAPGAGKKFEVLSRVYGISEKSDLHSRLSGATPQERKDNAVLLYLERLVNEFARMRGTGYAAEYPIRALTGEDKYRLVFATGNAKGAILASGVVYGIEETYQVEVQEFTAMQPRQLSLFSSDPTPQEIFEDKVRRLADDVWSRCRGRRLTRRAIHIAVMDNWFGKMTARHLTAALNRLIGQVLIVRCDGTVSNEATCFTFADSG